MGAGAGVGTRVWVGVAVGVGVGVGAVVTVVPVAAAVAVVGTSAVPRHQLNVYSLIRRKGSVNRSRSGDSSAHPPLLVPPSCSTFNCNWKAVTTTDVPFSVHQTQSTMIYTTEHSKETTNYFQCRLLHYSISNVPSKVCFALIWAEPIPGIWT